MQRGKNLIFITVTLLMLKNSKNQCKKTSQFKTQCKGDISHAFETAKITVFDPTRDYCEGDDGGKLPPISARGGIFAPWGDSKPSCLANITGFSWNNNLIILLLSQFYVI